MACGVWYHTFVEKTTLYLTDELRRRLKLEARRQGRPEAELVREALTGYLAGSSSPRPSSVGVIKDGSLNAAQAKAWVRKEWDRADRARAKRSRADAR